MATITNEPKETEYLAAAKSGNADAFARLYDTYIKQIYNFIFYKTMHQQIAEDICADVFLKAWKNLDQFKSGSFQAWLYSIARNAVIDHYRSSKEIKNIEDCWDLSADEDLLTKTDELIQIERIKEIISSLKLLDREILTMRFWQELSFAEIAEYLGKEEGAIKMACMRAIKKLKNKIPVKSLLFLLGLINIWKVIK
ncbi:MAG: sigma-70 family RNA polymerase sigma factor [Clostridia bacterium]|nr:sigma-70 family RNA polymerase sigma factor [Clostridia bacterium]